MNGIYLSGATSTWCTREGAELAKRQAEAAERKLAMRARLAVADAAIHAIPPDLAASFEYRREAADRRHADMRAGIGDAPKFQTTIRTSMRGSLRRIATCLRERVGEAGGGGD